MWLSEIAGTGFNGPGDLFQSDTFKFLSYALTICIESKTIF